MKINSLYIHIPFCNNICGYCDFTKVLYKEDFVDKYLTIITSQINNLKTKFKTIYIGGGSPSSLSYSQLELLLSSLENLKDVDTEFTIEINPEDMNEDKILLFKKYGINRVSIGVQSFNKNLLKLMNRHHDYELVKNVINKLKNVGITNINLDLIYGIPGQTKRIIKKDLKDFIKLGATHISTYALQLEDNTAFKIKGIEPLDDDIQASFYSYIYKYLYKKGFNRYEVSNFSLKGYESKHNLTYWHAEEYVGIGCGASGYENGIRYDNTRSLTKFLKDPNLKEETIIDDEDKEYEYIILNLRLREGIEFEDYKNRFNKDFKEEYKKEIDELLKNNLVEISKNRISVKDDKVFILNVILHYFDK